MKLRFYKAAEIELDDSVEFYNKEKPGLGYEFLEDVFETIKRH